MFKKQQGQVPVKYAPHLTGYPALHHANNDPQKFKIYKPDFKWLVERVTGLLGLTLKELLTGGKQRKIITARSVLYYWGTWELGMSAVAISKQLNIASSTTSESAARGLRIVEDLGLKLSDEDIR